MTQRIDIQREIARLDPKLDCQRIIFLSGTFDFSWDLRTSLELALFRTFAVPSISGLLAHTGEFERAPQRRYDDTAIFLNEILVNGYDSKRGAAFLERMNRIHAMYRIKNEDYLYTLSTFVFVPMDWIDRFGFRKLYPNERLAFFYFWREVGTRMGIAGIPETLESFRAFAKAFEATHFRFHETNKQVGDATLNLLLRSYLPTALHGAARPLAYAVMDEPLLRAMGYPEPGPAARALVEASLRARAKLLRALPKKPYPTIPVLQTFPTYPKGYALEDVGPDRLRPSLNQQPALSPSQAPPAAGCPFAAIPGKTRAARG